MPQSSKPKLSDAEKKLATKRRQFKNLLEREAKAEHGHQRNLATRDKNRCLREIQQLAAEVRREENDRILRERQDGITAS